MEKAQLIIFKKSYHLDLKQLGLYKKTWFNNFHSSNSNLLFHKRWIKSSIICLRSKLLQPIPIS